MKKIVSLLLLLTMLVLSVPIVSISVSAEGTTPLTVTHVSCTENQNNNTDPAVDWSDGWNWSKADDKNSGRLVGIFDEDFEMVGKFSEPTRITSVTLCSQYYNARMNGMRVYASEDGENWVNLFVLTDLSGSKLFNKINVNVSAAVGAKEYQYVKVSKPLKVFDQKMGGATANNAIYVDFRWVAFYNNPEEVKNFAEVNHISASSNAVAGIEAAWDFANTKLCRVSGNKAEEVLRGEFRYPVELSEIFIKLAPYQDRINNTAFEMSVDGETWKEVARITGGYKVSGEVIRLAVSDTTTQYKYVRIIRNHTYSAWDVLSFGFVGTEHPELVCGNVGSQTRSYTHEIKGDVYAVRFVSTVDESVMDAQSVGFEITATYESGSQTFDKSTSTVYTKIMDDGTARDASYFTEGHEYIFAITVDQIRIDTYDDITFTVKPYIVGSDGKKLYSSVYTVTYNDGILVG